MNWPEYWTWAGASGLALAFVMAWHMGTDPRWKESESSTDMLLNLLMCSIAGAVWPLTGLWLVLTTINDCARKRRTRAPKDPL